LKLKFQTVAEKTAKNFRELLYFAAPGTCLYCCVLSDNACIYAYFMLTTVLT